MSEDRSLGEETLSGKVCLGVNKRDLQLLMMSHTLNFPRDTKINLLSQSCQLWQKPIVCFSDCLSQQTLITYLFIYIY